MNSNGEKVGVQMAENPISEHDLKRLTDLLKTVSYGSITLIIQNGQVVQIEKNEKMRLK